MTWSIVGVGTVVEVTATTHTLTEPASVAAGDLLVACIASRIASTTAITLPAGWTRVTDQKINNVVLGTTGQASACMAYIIRGSSAPALGFTHPAAPNVARGQIIAYRENTAGGGISLDTSSPAATATAITAISIASSVTTTFANDLLVGMVAGGSAATYSAFKTANAPSTASGATNTSSTPSTTTWTERADASSTTGADIGLSVFDAVKTATGAGGAITATASSSSGHSVVMGAFAAQVPTADAWNINDRLNVTLSNSDKTATTPATANSGVRSTTTHLNGTAGKYYAEFLLDVGSTIPSRFGITPISNALDAVTSNFYVRDTTSIFINSVNVGGASVSGTLAIGSVICVAWDAGAEKVWFRHGSGNWENNASHDPATNTGGFDCSFAAATEHALWIVGTTAGRGATIRTELAEFTQAVPAGFTSWMGEKFVVASAGSYALTGIDVTLTKAGGGPTAYTLPADAGSYALSGQATSTELGRLVTAVSGSYALTGQVATLTKAAGLVHRTLPAIAGSYALTGVTAGLYRGRKVLSVAGSYGLTGVVTSLEYGREVAADPGSYALSGQLTNLELGKEVLALGGSYALTGAAASLLYARKPVAVPGSYSMLGVATSLEIGKEVLAVSGSYVLSGQVSSLRHAYRPVAVSGSYTLTGTPVNLLKPGSWAIIGLPGAYALFGQATSLEYGREVLATGGTYALSGAATSLELGKEVLAVAGSYALTGQATSLELGKEVAAVAGSYALTGVAASLERGLWILASNGSYTLSGATATFIRARRVTALGGNYALSGLPVNLLKTGAYAIIGLPGSYALSGAAATLTKTSVGDVFAWNPSTLTGIGSLSHDSLMVTAAPSISPITIESITWHSAGKHYAETTFTGGNPTGHWGLYNAGSDTGTLVDLHSGEVLQRPAGTLTSVFSPILDGDTLGLAYDGSDGTIWFRKNGGAWNDDLAQSPDSTGIGLWEIPSDVGCSGTLTPYVDADTTYRIVTDNAVIENMDFTGYYLYVLADNVTIRNCRVVTPEFFGIRADADTNVVGLTIDHCTISSDGRVAGIVTGNNFSVKNCDIFGLENGIFVGSDGTIENCYIHNLYGSEDAHIDGIQFAGQNFNVSISDCWVEAWNTACIFIKADSGSIDNITVENCTLINKSGEYTSSPIYTVSVSSHLVTNVFINRNRVQKGSPLFGGNYLLYENCTPECFYNIDYDTSEPILLSFQGFPVTGQSMSVSVSDVQVPPVEPLGVSTRVSGNYVGLAGDVAVATPTHRSHVLSAYGYVSDAHVAPPAGVVENDILIMAMFRGKANANISDPVLFTPGWTQIGDNLTFNYLDYRGQFSVWWRRATASEPSEHLWGFFEATDTQTYIAAYQNCTLAGAIDAYSQNFGNSPTATAFSVGTTQNTDILLWLGSNWTGSGSLTPPTGMTEFADHVLYVAEQTLTTYGETGNRTQTQAEDRPWNACLVALRGA